MPTTTPPETLGRVADFLRPHRVAAVGIACFGPIDLDRRSPTFGWITTVIPARNGSSGTGPAGQLAEPRIGGR